MKYLVCIKQVPDVAAPLNTGRMILNAYDASAVEASLDLRDQSGGDIRIVSIGPASVEETIRRALAMGADAATHIQVENVDAYSRLDSHGFACILSDHLRDPDYDVVLCGKQAQDSDAGLTGSMLAEMLQLPYASNAVALNWEDRELVVTRHGDTGNEIIALPTPCLVTCSNDMNDPRVPSLSGVMAARKKKIDVVAIDELPEMRTFVVRYEQLPARERGEIVEADSPELAGELLVDRLHNVEKVL